MLNKDTIRHALRNVPDTLRLFILQKIEENEGHLQDAIDRRVARQRWLAAIREYNQHGVVALCHWSRDCDCCEATYREEIEAVPAVIDARMNEILDGAEGPTRFWLQRVSDPFERSFRDRALEAFEDGHPHHIY